MRTLRLPLVGTVILALLGWPTVALAQTEEEPGSITAVTGTMISSLFDDSDEEYSVDSDGIGHARGARLTQRFTYSDSRLPADKRIILNFDIYPLPDVGKVWVATTTVRLDGPDGYWTGTGRFFGPVDSWALDKGVYAASQDVLVGHGAYEGQLAVLGCTSEAGCSGYIVEGSMPPLPEPIEPPAE